MAKIRISEGTIVLEDAILIIATTREGAVYRLMMDSSVSGRDLVKINEEGYLEISPKDDVAEVMDIVNLQIVESNGKR